MPRLTLISIGTALLAFTSVATSLRLHKLPIGVSESLIMMLFTWLLIKKKSMINPKHPIVLFWVSIIIISIIAASLSKATGAGATHTTIAYIYSTCFSITALAYLQKLSSEELKSVIKALAIIPTALLLIPFFIFLSGSSNLSDLFELNTYLPNRFSAWSANPNQLALLLLPIPIWFIASTQQENWQGIRLVRNLLFIWITFLIGMCIRSDALLLSWSIGLPILLLISFFWSKPIERKIQSLSIVAFVLAFGLFKLMSDGIDREYFPNLANSDSTFGVGFDKEKANVRKTLRDQATHIWLKSPIIGNGPGAFSYLKDPEDRQEAHNLILDLLTQTGITGVSVFTALYIWLLIRAYQSRDPYSLTVLIILMIFSAAHFTLRQPLFSLYIILCSLMTGSNRLATEQKKQPL
ncbi:O-antigen ligase family protein [Pseudomonas piscis]|uniref:O-antigen ligase family protein n=1 Tax=Pseudomonas piscis TaxID=2614538 RepID=A0ABY9NCG2_9PSED|nr:O-antigen ligase family protein [Pseudomonas piscis]WMN16071.1 O-antigen ligase family protein [Pseudomonas piscis]